MKTIDRAWGAGLLAMALWGCGDSHADSEPVHNDAAVRADTGLTDADGGEPGALDVFVGEVADSDVLVAVLANDTRARLFFCGGETNVASDTHWFNISHEGSELTAQDGDFGLNAQLRPAAISGEYRIGTQRHSWSGKKITPGSLAGLYEGTGDCGRLGLIVSPSTPGLAPRAQGACVGGDHAPEQVNPILPISLQNGGVRVQGPGEDGSVLLRAAGL